jgi:hypothetical protein
LANRGFIALRDFAYPYGPLTLALQQLSLAVTGNGPLGFALLTLLATMLFAWAMMTAIRALRPDAAPALLLTVAPIVAALCMQWVPVYALELAALAWALVLWARGQRGPALAWLVAGALIKPTMSVVLGTWFLAGTVTAAPRGSAAAWRRVLIPPLATAAVLLTVLGFDFGGHGLINLALPLAGMRAYRARHFSFFSLENNPFIVPRGQLVRYLVTPLSMWALGLLGLAAAVWLLARRSRPFDSPKGMRWCATAACLLGTIAFILRFYAWRGSYVYYITLPLIGLGLAPWGSKLTRTWRAALVTIAAVAVLGTASQVRYGIWGWRQERPSATSAYLWATPEETAAWAHFAAANPSGSRPLFIDNDGSPESLFPAYGPPWHGYLDPGYPTERDFGELQQRLTEAQCIVLTDATFGHFNVSLLNTAQLQAIKARLPHVSGALVSSFDATSQYDTYGCNP